MALIRKALIFRRFNTFWRLSNTAERPLIAFIYAVHHDTLLSNTIEVVSNVTPGKKVSVELIEAEVEKYHPKSIFGEYAGSNPPEHRQLLEASWFYSRKGQEHPDPTRDQLPRCLLLLRISLFEWFAQ